MLEILGLITDEQVTDERIRQWYEEHKKIFRL